MRMRLLLPSLCLLSSTSGTLLAKVAEADGINLVDDNRLQDNEAVAPGPLQPVSRGLRRGGGLQMPTFLKLGESDNGYYYNNAKEDGDNGECVNGDAFKDSMGFNCTLYEGARWCEVNDEGKTVEGPGWCSVLNPQECDVPAERRWSRHRAFKNQQGQWAKSCCCNTGLAATYPYEGGGECTDAPDSKAVAWHDPYGLVPRVPLRELLHARRGAREWLEERGIWRHRRLQARRDEPARRVLHVRRRDPG